MASALDSATTNFQLVANLDSGALNVPLQAAGKIGGQIVDIVKVSNQLFVLPAQQWITYVQCIIELRAPLASVARKREWNEADHAKRTRLARKLVRRYLSGVVRVAQFTAYERLFALWHMAHVPFVYIMVISAVAHVIAVHAY